MEKSLRLPWALAILAALGMYALALWFGEVNQDEGWYLYAGRLVAEGQTPFVDFASTQGPVMAYVYALAQPLVELWGVAGGRVFTAILGFCTALASAFLAHRVSRTAFRLPPAASRIAALTAFAFLSLNLYHVYFTTIVKTYSLAGLLVVCGFLALGRSIREQTGRHAALAGGLIALAAGVRLSAGVLLPVVWLSILLYWLRRGRQGETVRVLVGFLAGGTVMLLAVYVPFMFAAPEALKFGLLDYHGGRAVGSLAVALAYKGGFLVRLAGAYFPLIVLSIVLGGWRVGRAEQSEREGTGPLLVTTLVASIVAVTIVHLVAVFPYDDYQVFIMPLLAVVVGVGLSCGPVSLSSSSHPALLLTAFILCLLMHSAASPMLQGWLLAERDRIWWPLRTETSMQRLQRAGALIRDHVTTSTTGEQLPVLLTQDTYLAVEAGLRVPQGMELGPFSLFPEMLNERAETLHVLNRGMLRDLLASTEAPLAAFSGYGLAIQCPEISQLPVDEQGELWRMVESRYEQVAAIEAFGQADTRLRVLRRK